MAIALVLDHGVTTKGSGSAFTTIAHTLGTAISAGNVVEITVSVSSSSASAFGATDTQGNTYVADVTRSGAASITGAVIRSNIGTGLAISNIITVSWTTGVKAAAMSTSVWSGLDASPLDKTASATGSSLTPDSGVTATTTVADELVYGGVAWDYSINDGVQTVTPGSGLTGLTAGRISQGALRVGVRPLYKIVSATGTYKIDGTMSTGTGTEWAAMVSTQKIASAVTTSMFMFNTSTDS